MSTQTDPCCINYVDPRPYRFLTEYLKQRIKVAAKQRRLLKDQKREIRDEARKLWRQEQDNPEFPSHLSEKRRALYRMVVDWKFLPHDGFVRRVQMRAMYLAYAFCRGKTYRSVEPHTRNQYERGMIYDQVVKQVWDVLIFHRGRDRNKKNHEALKDAVYKWLDEKDQPPETPNFDLSNFEEEGPKTVEALRRWERLFGHHWW